MVVLLLEYDATDGLPLARTMAWSTSVSPSRRWPGGLGDRVGHLFTAPAAGDPDRTRHALRPISSSIPDGGRGRICSPTPSTRRSRIAWVRGADVGDAARSYAGPHLVVIGRPQPDSRPSCDEIHGCARGRDCGTRRRRRGRAGCGPIPRTGAHPCPCSGWTRPSSRGASLVRSSRRCGLQGRMHLGIRVGLGGAGDRWGPVGVPRAQARAAPSAAAEDDERQARERHGLNRVIGVGLVRPRPGGRGVVRGEFGCHDPRPGRGDTVSPTTASALPPRSLGHVVTPNAAPERPVTTQCIRPRHGRPGPVYRIWTNRSALSNAHPSAIARSVSAIAAGAAFPLPRRPAQCRGRGEGQPRPLRARGRWSPPLRPEGVRQVVPVVVRSGSHAGVKCSGMRRPLPRANSSTVRVTIRPALDASALCRRVIASREIGLHGVHIGVIRDSPLSPPVRAKLSRPFRRLVPEVAVAHRAPPRAGRRRPHPHTCAPSPRDETNAWAYAAGPVRQAGVRRGDRGIPPVVIVVEGAPRNRRRALTSSGSRGGRGGGRARAGDRSSGG